MRTRHLESVQRELAVLSDLEPLRYAKADVQLNHTLHLLYCITLDLVFESLNPDSDCAP